MRVGEWVSACRSVFHLSCLCLTFLLACSSPGFDCDACVQSGQVCSYEKEACLPACVSDADCGGGKTCTLVADKLACCEPCRQSQCPTGMECSSACGACQPVECGRYVQCAAADEFCDLDNARCLPENGSCLKVPCPSYTAASLSVADVSCSDAGICRTERAQPVLSYLHAESMVSLTVPTPGQEYVLGEAPSFSWTPQADAVLLQLFRSIPVTQEEFLRSVVWGATVEPGGTPEVSWADGYVVEAGVWGDHPARPPERGAYYALLQVLRRDVLVAQSPLILFVVGEVITYPQPGNPCTGEPFSGSCDNPGRPLACVARVCRAVCASDEDCLPSRCEFPVGGLRYCAL